MIEQEIQTRKEDQTFDSKSIQFDPKALVVPVVTKANAARVKTAVITVNKSKILPEYLCALLNMYQRHKVFYSICTNWNNQSGIGLDLLKSLYIPLIPDDRQESLRRQQQIVDKIYNIYQEADECILSAK